VKKDMVSKDKRNEQCEEKGVTYHEDLRDLRVKNEKNYCLRNPLLNVGSDTHGYVKSPCLLWQIQGCLKHRKQVLTPTKAY